MATQHQLDQFAQGKLYTFGESLKQDISRVVSDSLKGTGTYLNSIATLDIYIETKIEAVLNRLLSPKKVE